MKYNAYVGYKSTYAADEVDPFQPAAVSAPLKPWYPTAFVGGSIAKTNFTKGYGKTTATLMTIAAGGRSFGVDGEG